MRNLRQSLLAAVIAAAMPFSALAQSAGSKLVVQPLNGKTGNISWKNKVMSGGNRVMAMEPMILDSLANAYSYFTNNQQPLQWDPVSNTMVTIKRGNPEQSGNLIFIRRSQDLGRTWSEAEGPLNDPSAGLARYPSILIINENETTTNPDELYYAYSAPLVTPDGAGFGPVLSGFIAGGEGIPEVTPNVTIGGESFTWSTDAKMAATKDGQVILAVSKLSPPSTVEDLNAGNNFALRRNEGFNTWSVIVPEQWNQTKWATPTQAGTSTSETVGLQRDPAGNFHMAAQGRFLASENSERVTLGVSSSTDNGLTWSEFNVMPLSTMRSYASANGMQPDSVFMSFTASDFVVTGTNQFSFIANLFESGLNDAGESATINAHLVEVYNSGGTWNMRKVADVSGLVLAYLPDPNTGEEVTNQMGNEVQVARTADGTKLIAKWVEFYTYTANNGADTITGGDVTMAMRNLNDDKGWSNSVNVTNDVFFDRTTWIPNIVPNDLQNIVVLSTSTILDGSEQTIEDIQAKLRQLVTPQHVIVQSVDPQFTFGTSINEEVANNLRLGSVMPNPASTSARFSYTLLTDGAVSVEVVNVMGQKVLTLDNGFKTAGDHTVTFNAAELPAGTYYYTLKHTGGSITRMMTIVR